MSWFKFFGSGKGYVPQETIVTEKQAEQLQAQGLFDVFSFFDKETIEKVKDIIAAIDPDTIKAVMQTIETDEDGKLHVNIDLTIRK